MALKKAGKRKGGGGTPRGGLGAGWLLLLAAAAWFTWRGVLHSEFIGDDNTRILNCVSYFEKGYLSTITSVLPDRPFLMLTIFLNYRAGGIDPYGYKLVSLLLHILFGGMLFWLLRCLGREAGGGREASAGAALFALLFLLHPVNSQAIMSSIQRGVILAAIGAVGCFHFYLRYLDEQRGRLYLLSLLFFTVGLFSKEFAVTAPFIILLYLAATKGLRGRTIVHLTPHLLLCAYPALMYFAWGVNTMEPEKTLSRIDYLTVQARVIFLYLGKILYPFNLRFSYEINPDPSLFANLTWLAAAGHAVIVLTGIALLRKIPLAGFGILAAYAAFSAESGFFPIEHLAFEHRVYFPMVFISIALYGYALHRRWLRKKLLYLPALAAAASLAVLTVRQVERVGTYERWTLHNYGYLEKNEVNNVRLLADLYNLDKTVLGERLAAEMTAAGDSGFYEIYRAMFSYRRLDNEAKGRALRRTAAFLARPQTHEFELQFVLRQISTFVVDRAGELFGGNEAYYRMVEPVLRNEMTAFFREPVRYEREIAMHKGAVRFLSELYRKRSSAQWLGTGDLRHYLDILGLAEIYFPGESEAVAAERARLATVYPGAGRMIRVSKDYYDALQRNLGIADGAGP